MSKSSDPGAAPKFVPPSLRQRFSDVGLRTKLLGAVCVLLIILGSTFMVMFSRQIRDTAHQDSLMEARRVVDTAESVREGMQLKWSKGVFTQELLRDWADRGEIDRVLESVPIVSAWNAVMRKAEQGGYTFKTPRRDARNADNEPDAVELRALEAFASSADRHEYFELDEVTNSLRYFRPIRLSKECMICHGSPTTSSALWGNSEGLDSTGHSMEGLKPGDLHGAFEIIQSMDAVDARSRSATLKGLFIVGVIIAVACALLAWLLNSWVLRPIAATASAFKGLIDGDLRQTLTVTGGDEVGMLQAGVNTMVEKLRGMILNLQNS